MKLTIFLTVILLSLLGCKESSKKEKITIKPEKIEKTPITESEIIEKLDTTVVYWQTNYDTTKEIKTLEVADQKYELEIISYSKNDSSIIKFNDLNKPTIYKDIYHDNISIINLKKDSHKLSVAVKRNTFSDSLDGDFLKYSRISWIEYRSIDSNRIYFDGVYNVPDTDWSVGFEFNINHESGLIEYSNFTSLD